MAPKSPKVEAPVPPANAPTKADASVVSAGLRDDATGFSSMISSGPQGLTRKPETMKRSLIGGAR